VTKEEFFRDLEEIKSDRLFITESTDNVEKEIRHNCWSISLTDSLAKECTVEDLMNFLAAVKINRRKQLRDSNNTTGLIYYLWIDQQAGQLRFNFINSNHRSLPFKAQLTFSQTEVQIVAEYLKLQFGTFNSVEVYMELIAR
jgi:hypothetical protein